MSYILFNITIIRTRSFIINNIIFTFDIIRSQNLAFDNENDYFIFSELDIILELPIDNNSSIDILRLNLDSASEKFSLEQDNKSLPSSKPISLHKTSNISIKYEIAIPSASRKSNLCSIKPLSSA